MRGKRFLDDQATTAIVSFAVVVAIFGLAFGALMTVLREPARQQEDGPVLDAKADQGLLEVVATSGYFAKGATKAKAWLEDPDNITRFGLAQEGDSSLLDLDKLRNLTKGGMARDSSNKFLDYEEARDALGLGKWDFHLRTYPLFDALDDAGITPVRNLNVAYIGDFEEQGGGGSSNYPVQYTKTLTVQDKFVNLSVTITNNGSVATVFQVEYTVPLERGNLIDTANTPLLQPNEAWTTVLRLYKTSSWDWEDAAEITVKINDVSKKVAEWVEPVGTNMASPSYGPHAAVVASPGALVYKLDKKPRIHYEVFEGDGDDVNGQGINISIRDSAGALVRSWEGNTGGSGHKDFDALPAGFYNITVRKTSDSAFNSTDGFQVTNATVGEFTTVGGATNRVETASSKYERALVGTLVEGFVNRTYDNASGDVYPDLKKVMNNDLADNLTLDAYDILVVGSNVDHNAMTSSAAKDSVKDWTLRGGLLVVLGSQDQNVNWLQPLFKAKLTTSGNGIGVPDEHHPILHTPQELDYKNFKDNGKAWEFNGDDQAAGFTHVILRDGANKHQDVLGVSKPGHFGNGTILLTTWTLDDLSNQDNWNQALGTLYNFLLQAWGVLYVDMGPAIPDRVEVASSVRMATAPSPVHAGEQVLVRVVLYVFR
jgi:hypothetical protein